MRRSYDKHIRLTKEERDDWQRKAAMTCLNESSLIRLLMKGYAPKEKPDERFFEAMRELSAIGNNLNQLTHIANATGRVSASQLDRAQSLLEDMWHCVRDSL